MINTVTRTAGRATATHLPLLDSFPYAFLYSFHWTKLARDDLPCVDICFDRKADAVELWAELRLEDILTGHPKVAQIRVSFTSSEL